MRLGRDKFLERSFKLVVELGMRAGEEMDKDSEVKATLKGNLAEG